MISKKLVIFLTSWIIENTEFEEKIKHPIFSILSSSEMSDKACFSSQKCKVKAFYHKEEETIFYIDELKPEEKICDLSIILHEIVHHYQKNENRKFDLDKETIWILREKQAMYYQNLFLVSQKRKNKNIGPENIIQCQGGSYLDLQYKYNNSK